MKKGKRQSSNIGSQGSPYANAKEPFMETSPHEPALIKAAGQENRQFTGSSMQRLRDTKMAKQREADAKRIGADVSKRMDDAAKSDKMSNVANAIRRAQGKGDIKRNPFDTARSK